MRCRDKDKKRSHSRV